MVLMALYVLGRAGDGPDGIVRTGTDVLVMVLMVLYALGRAGDGPDGIVLTGTRW